MQWDKLIPVLSDHFDPTQSDHAIPPEEIALIIMLDGSSSIATLARLTDNKPEELYVRLQVFEKKGFLEWRETKKAVKKYSTTSRSSSSLGEAPKVLGNQRIARRPTSSASNPSLPQPSVSSASNPNMPKTPAPPTKTPDPPSRASSSAMPQVPSRMKGRRTRAKQPPKQTPPPPSQERPTGSSHPSLQQTPAPPSVRKAPESAELRQTPPGGRPSESVELQQSPGSLQQTPPPASTRMPAIPAGLQQTPASGTKGKAKSKFRPFRAKGSNSTLKRKATGPKAETATPEQASSPFDSMPREQVPTPKVIAASPEPRIAETPSVTQQAPKPATPVAAQKSSDGFAPMPLTSWELAKRRKEQGEGDAVPAESSVPSTPSSSGVMDLTGFEETVMAPSPDQASASFEKFDGLDDEASKKPALSALQQAADDAAMQMKGPGKPAKKQEPLKPKAEAPGVPQEAEEEEWDSVDDWWAMAPEDVGLRSEDYAELIQKRKERQMAMEGNRDEEEEDDDFTPMWRTELFDSVN